jgi:hypothetical protein
MGDERIDGASPRNRFLLRLFGHDLLDDPPEKTLVLLERYLVGELVGDLEPAAREALVVEEACVVSSGE